MWPYRLVTCVWQALLREHPDRLDVEAFTPATSVVHRVSTNSKAALEVQTPRGSIKASSVLHCTNGFASRLIPGLVGKIFPLRGTMTVQEPPSSLTNHGGDRSWAFLRQPEYDTKSGLFDPGLDYLTQNATSGLFFFGGEKTSLADTFNDDDTIVTETSKTYLHEKLCRSFGVDRMGLVAAWSGIMGFTGDHLPLVGRLPASLTAHGDGGQFIAAGFNGYGMPTCWLAGEAIAQLALGEAMPQHVPETYIITEERLQQLTARGAAEAMLGGCVFTGA